jgi:hypothetical protein
VDAHRQADDAMGDTAAVGNVHALPFRSCRIGSIAACGLCAANLAVNRT